jgi:hypothetical protein
MTAQREDLSSHPAVAAPLAHLDQPSNAHETALAMEMANHRLAEDSEASTPTMSTAATSPEPDQTPTTEKYAFAFDIDGVLIRGGKVLPEAIEAMKLLNGQNEFNIKVCVASGSYIPYNTNQYYFTGHIYSSPMAVANQKRNVALIYRISCKWKSLLASSSVVIHL